jgi:hypothetical protein
MAERRRAPAPALQWEALHDEADGLWKPKLREASPNDLKALTAISEAQGVYGRLESQARFDALLASYEAGTEHGKNARARLCCGCRPASAWLDTLPVNGDLTLKSGDIRTCLRHRLGLCVLPLHAPTLQCAWGSPQQH